MWKSDKMGPSLSEIRRRSWQALVNELGYPRATKFTLPYKPGRGDYVRDREEFLNGITIETIRDDILQNKS